MSKRWILALALLSTALFSSTAEASDTVTPSQIMSSFDLGNGIEGEVILTFEDPTGLVANSLDITASLVSLSNPCAVCQRFPAGVFIPHRFPVLIEIEPNVAGFNFRGRWTLEVITERLPFTGDTPLRLFRARTSVSDFKDISSSVGFGSFRVLGTGGSFSQFAIAADLRPIRTAANTKFDRIQDILDDPFSGISAPLLSQLNNELTSARNAWDADNASLALSLLSTLIQTVIDNSGSGIPNVWDPGQNDVSVAGQIRGVLRSLRFSLSLSDREDGTENSELTVLLAPGNGLSAELTLSFDNAADVAFDATSLGISSQIINPLDYVSRLPAGVQVPSEFPVLIEIDPEAGQSFTGTFSVELRTEDLTFAGNSPLRLFKAEPGEMFEDISRTYGVGSFRVLGTGGSFSEFLVVRDLRSIDAILVEKFAQAELFLDDNIDDVPNPVRLVYEEVHAHYLAGEIPEAIEDIDLLLAALRANQDDIPAIWLPDGSVVNVVGIVRQFTYSLRLSLVLKNSPPTLQPGDVDQDGNLDIDDIFLLINQVFGGGSNVHW